MMQGLQRKSNNFYFLIPAILIIVPAVALISVNHGLMGFLRDSAPGGQMLYLLSKICGLCAFTLLFLQVLITIFRKTKMSLSFLETGNAFHIALGVIIFLVVLLHGSLFVSAVSLRSGHLALHLLLPDLTNGYYARGVSLGVISLYLIVISVIFGYTSRKLKSRSGVFARGHLLVYLLAITVLIHARMIGSEIQSGWLQAFYWLVMACFAVIGTIRLAGFVVRTMHVKAL